MTRRTASAVLRFLIAGAWVASPALAQTRASASGTISGLVIDATTAAPIAGATVTLAPMNGDGLFSGARASSVGAELARSITTSSVGAYQFGALPIGAYRLYVRRVRYMPVTLEVRLGETGSSPLSIGLVVAPVRLQVVEVRASDTMPPLDRRSAASNDDARIAAARARQQAFLSTDARELTGSDLEEAATLGDADVLRALQRLPGVTPFDDWSAKLWVRGNRWDHNRVYYDDLPLFDPLQALGRTSGVSADAIGAAFLHPGVRPASLGGEGATRIDLRSRPAAANGDWHGDARLSRFGAAGAVEHASRDESAGFAVTAEHTLAEWLPRARVVSNMFGDRSFSDAQVTLRADFDLGNGRRIETSGLASHDTRRQLDGPARADGDQDWGNVVGRVSLRAPLGSFATVHTIGVSHFASSSSRWLARTFVDSTAPPTEQVTNSPVVSSVDYTTLRGRIEPSAPSRHRVSGGYDVTLQRSSFGGMRQSLYWGDLSVERATRRDALNYGSVWGEDRLELGGRLMIETGIRLDAGGSHLDAVRPAGTAQARVVLSPRTWLSLGASRVHQYVQAVEQPILAYGETAPALWVTSGADVPTMTVDNAMIGVERWMATGVLASANAYARRTAGIVTGDPTPGLLIARPLFTTATESARGIEFSARKLAGHVTGLVAYSYAGATTHASGLAFDASADRTHALDVVLAAHAHGWSLGGAYALASGAPYTRTTMRPATGSMTGLVAARELPNATRMPLDASLDLSLDHTHSVRGAQLTEFARVQNVLDRKNATWYRGAWCGDDQGQSAGSVGCRGRDLFAAPAGVASTVGLRVLF